MHLVKKLNCLGIKTEINNREDMMERTWEIRKFVSSDCKEFSDSGVLSVLLGLEDYSLRLNAFSEIFLNSPKDTIVAELHAMDKLVFAASTSLLESHHFMRVPNARVLVCTDPLLALREASEIALARLEVTGEYVPEPGKKQFNESLEIFLNKLKERFRPGCTRAA